MSTLPWALLIEPPMPRMCWPAGQLALACENSCESTGLEAATRWIAVTVHVGL